jgi:hypothetical protein
MSQNLLSVGINLSQFEADKQALLTSAQDLFTKLTAYDNTKISPISVSGLTELNASIAQTNTSITSLKSSVSEFGLAMQAYNKTADAVAKTQAQIAITGSDEAKELANLKVQLAELNKQNLENAKSNNTIIQQRNLQAAQQKALLEREKQDMQSVAAIRIQNNAMMQKEVAQQLSMQKNLDIAEKQYIADKKAQAAADKQAAIEILKLNDAYKLLLQQQKGLQAEYSRLYASGQGGTPQAKSVLNDLRQVNGVVNQIDKDLEKAGTGGATAFARSLTGMLSQLRTLAYILPGIGIAGLFNLAFEAIESAADSLFDFRSAFDKIIEDQKNFSDELEKSNALLTEQAELIKNQQTASDLAYYNRQKQLSDAAQESPSNKFLAERDINKSAKIQADNEVASYGATYSKQADLISKLQSLDEQKIKIAEGLKKADAEITKIENERLGLHGIVQATLEKTGRLSGAKSIKEDLQKEYEALDKEFNATKDLYDKSGNALKTQAQIDADIKAQQLKEDKFYYDQHRKIVLDNIETEINERKKLNDLILSSPTSTEQQREGAVQSNLLLEKKLSAAKLNFELSDKSTDPNSAEKNKARNNYNQEVINNAKDTARELENIEKEFYSRRAQFQETQLQDEITRNQLSQENIFKNEEASYAERIIAYSKYIDDRKLAINQQYDFDVDKVRRNVPADLQQNAIDQLTAARNKQLLEVTQNTQDQVYSITESYYKKQIKLIEESNKQENNVALDAETEKLRNLNDAFDAQLISRRKFEKIKKDIIDKAKIEEDKENIRNDNSGLQKLFGLRSDLTAKVDVAKEKFINAATPDEAQQSGAELSGLLKDVADVNSKIIDSKKQLSKDLNQLELDRNKKEEDNRKHFYANLLILEKSLFNTIKKYVDQSYDYRAEKLKEQQEAYDENVEKEEDAIKRSTLNQKDKNAYEIQLEAQKTAADKKYAQEQKKIAHDKAVFDRDIDIAEIITSTSLAVAKTLAEGGAFSIPLAISVGALGATAIAAALATKIPAYALGGIHKEAGLALYGEAGTELVKEPNKRPFLATKPTLSYLSAGTELIPMYDSPNISDKKYTDDSWSQTKYLANVINKANKKTNNVIKANINISFKNLDYREKILHG